MEIKNLLQYKTNDYIYYQDDNINVFSFDIKNKKIYVNTNIFTYTDWYEKDREICKLIKNNIHILKQCEFSNGDGVKYNIQSCRVVELKHFTNIDLKNIFDEYN